MKALKITPNNIIEIENDRKDEFYKNFLAGYAIYYPSIWKHKKYNLAMFMKDLFDKNDQYNHIATLIYDNLKIPNQILDQKIYGDIIITNEDEKGNSCNFTKDDLDYLLKMIKEIKN